MTARPETRRWFLTGIVLATGTGVCVAGLSSRAGGQGMLAPTPACDDGDEPTPAQTEGPFFKRGSPERSVLREPGMKGTPILLAGSVLTRSCQPVANAAIELWHADAAGVYDNDGYRLRGRQFTDAQGRYGFDTIVPGLYPGRTRHFHLKFRALERPVLTTQFYFPDEPMNRVDPLFRPELLLHIAENPRKTALFVTVLDID